MNSLEEQNAHDAAQARWQAWLESDEGRAVIAEQRKRVRRYRRLRCVGEYAAVLGTGVVLLALGVLAMFAL